MTWRRPRIAALVVSASSIAGRSAVTANSVVSLKSATRWRRGRTGRFGLSEHETADRGRGSRQAEWDEQELERVVDGLGRPRRVEPGPGGGALGDHGTLLLADHPPDREASPEDGARGDTAGPAALEREDGDAVHADRCGQAVGERRRHTRQVALARQRGDERRDLPAMLPTGPGLILHRGMTTDLGAHAGHELGDRDRLDDHIVRALVEAGHPIRLDQRAGREDHRERPNLRIGTELAQGIEPAQAGHVDVEQQHLDRVAADELERAPAVRRQEHREAGPLEGASGRTSGCPDRRRRRRSSAVPEAAWSRPHAEVAR